MVCKCNNCGIQYVESLTECPYCGVPNLRHLQFVNSVQKLGAFERMMEYKERHIRSRNN